MIVKRTQEDKALAKQRDDFREGRPRKHSKQQVQHALELYIQRSGSNDRYR